LNQILIDQLHELDIKNIEVVKQSERPDGDKRGIINKIINNGTQVDDLDSLGKEIMDGKIKKWNDVGSEEIMQAQISFSVDDDLDNDPNIPKNLQKL
jgi:hypothetical protein